jgi:hypothetical protein
MRIQKGLGSRVHDTSLKIIGMQVVDIADFEMEEQGYTHAYGVGSVVRRPGPSLRVVS